NRDMIDVCLVERGRRGQILVGKREPPNNVEAVLAAAPLESVQRRLVVAAACWIRDKPKGASRVHAAKAPARLASSLVASIILRRGATGSASRQRHRARCRQDRPRARMNGRSSPASGRRAGE